jgi:hypothetical protein
MASVNYPFQTPKIRPRLSILFIIILFFSLTAQTVSDSCFSVALVDLEINGISPSEAIAVCNRLRTELFETKRFKVLERSRMNELFKEQKFQLTGCTDSECASKIGLLLSVDHVVLGNIDLVGNLTSITLRMVNVKTGEIERSITEDCDSCHIEKIMTTLVHNAAIDLAGLEDKNQSVKPPDSKKNEPSIYNKITGKLWTSFSYTSVFNFDHHNINGLEIAIGKRLGPLSFGGLLTLAENFSSDEDIHIKGGGIQINYNLINVNNYLIGGPGINVGIWQMKADQIDTKCLSPTFRLCLGIPISSLFVYVSNNCSVMWAGSQNAFRKPYFLFDTGLLLQL